MNEYKCVPLGENVEEMFIGPFGSSLKNECFVDEDEAYCMVYEQKHAIQKTMDVETRYVNEQKYNELKRFNIHGGDIIVSCRGTIGETFVVPEDAPLGIMHPSIMKIRLKDGVYDKYYFNLLLKSRLKKHEAEANGSGIKMAISATELGRELFPVPTMQEQQEITDIISGISDVIEKRKQELSALDDLIKARFVEMFGDAVANPMHWPVKKLKELSVQINSGNTPKGGSENYVEEGITFFRSQNVWKDRLEMDDIAYIDATTHASMKRSSLKHGDILMTKTGRINTENSSLGRAALYDGEDDMANVNGHVYFIRLKDGVNNKFVLRILVSPEYRELIRSVCVGGIDKRQLNKEHIEDFPIICPPSDMVDDYILFVNQVDKSKVAVQKALEETQVLFDSLMQQYFG